ncbi:ATP-binding protein [Actinoplanes sp. NPDC051633]|uniref:ATP-binding protein n=1 Tax=Actinoplanes sp. NPDC051633 TaxID=3155670 RepID=UPI003413273B
MASEVTYPVDTDQPYPVIRLSGVLAPVDAAGLRATVLDVLAMQPEAVVIDAEAVRLEDPAPARELAGLVSETAEWPAGRVVIATGHRDPWAASGLVVCPDVAGALAQLGEPHPGDRRQLTLQPVIGAARRARELVTEACAQWDCPDVCGPACIVVTEMVNNVVAHAKSEMTVLLARLGDTISVAVRDGSATIPRFTGPVSPTAYGGRGLLLIDAVSDRWGSLSLHDGKVVWSLLPLDQVGEPAGRPATGAGIPDPARG